MADFKGAVEDFTATMDALRDFVRSVGPVLLQRQDEAQKTGAPTAASWVIAAILTQKFDGLGLPENVRQALINTRDALSGTAADATPEKIARIRQVVQKMAPVKFTSGGPELDTDHPSADEFLSRHRAITRANRELPLLYESAIMALTSRSEWFIAQLIHVFFERYPEAAGMSDPFFSLESLVSLGTIEEAREALLEHKVESLMRQSFDDWLRFFKQVPKLSMGYLDEHVSTIREVFKRRNLIVHNGGRVSRKYMEEVEESLRPGLAVGSIVHITPDYLNASIDLMEHKLVLISSELWKKLDPRDEARSTSLLALSIQCLEENRWGTARGLSYFVMNDSQSSEYARLSGQINYWQSFKWPGSYGDVRKEVEEADFSAKRPLFQLALAAIKDDFEQFFKLLPAALASGELKGVELRTWPLFQGVRQRPEFAAFESKSAHETVVEGQKAATTS